MSILVEFRGTKYWYLGKSLADLDHALVPLDHCDDSGNILPSAAYWVSYAHVFGNGVIKRYNRAIGIVGDLKLDRSQDDPPEAKQ